MFSFILQILFFNRWGTTHFCVTGTVFQVAKTFITVEQHFVSQIVFHSALFVANYHLLRATDLYIATTIKLLLYVCDDKVVDTFQQLFTSSRSNANIKPVRQILLLQVQSYADHKKQNPWLTALFYRPWAEQYFLMLKARQCHMLDSYDTF